MGNPYISSDLTVCGYISQIPSQEELKKFAKVNQRLMDEYFTTRADPEWCNFWPEKEDGLHYTITFEIERIWDTHAASNFYDDILHLINCEYKKKQKFKELIALDCYLGTAHWLANEIEEYLHSYDYDCALLDDIDRTLTEVNKIIFVHLRGALMRLRNGRGVADIDSKNFLSQFKRVYKYGLQFDQSEADREYIDKVANNIYRQVKVLSYLRACTCREVSERRKLFMSKAHETVPLIDHIVFTETGDIPYKAIFAAALFVCQHGDEAKITSGAPNDILGLMAIYAYHNMEDMCYAALVNPDPVELMKNIELSYLSILAVLLNDIVFDRFDNAAAAIFHPITYPFTDIIFLSICRTHSLVTEEKRNQAKNTKTNRIFTEQDKESTKEACKDVWRLFLLTLSLPIFAIGYILGFAMNLLHFIINLPVFIVTLLLAIPVGISNFIANLFRSNKNKKK